MSIYGIGESAERETKRPSRARVIIARASYRVNQIDAWVDRHIVAVFGTLGALAIVAAITCATLTEMNNYLSGKLFTILASATMSALGVLFIAIAVSEHTQRQANALARRVSATYRATIARADKAHALEIGKVSKQLLDTIGERDEMRDTLTRERNELRAQLRETQLGAHNLAWALVEDNDIREMTARDLSQIARDHLSDNRAQVFATCVVLDYARDGLYSYDASLSAKIESGLVDWSNYNRDRD